MEKYKEKKAVMDGEEIARMIRRLAHEIVEKNRGVKDLAVIGIQTRGVFVAQRLVEEILKTEHSADKSSIPFGSIDTTLYRDDLDTLESPPPVKETDIAFDITNKRVVLVDDVLFTGRSIRAALDQLMDFGRPQNIQLAVLIDRGHRELPIEPNYTGKKIPTAKEELVSVELVESDGTDRVVISQKNG